jgi:hypothetical protein
MSLPIRVDGYPGLYGRPAAFELDGVYYPIYAVEAEWRIAEALFFKVRADGKRVILRYDENGDEWTLLSAYDGRDLLARRGIQAVGDDANVTRAAERRIESCQVSP